MRKKKNGFFVSNQGGLEPEGEVEQEPAFAGLPVASQPLWKDVGGGIEIFQEGREPEKLDPGTLEEIKGGERLW